LAPTGEVHSVLPPGLCWTKPGYDPRTFMWWTVQPPVIAVKIRPPILREIPSWIENMRADEYEGGSPRDIRGPRS